MSAVYKSICNEVDSFLFLITRLAEKEIQLKLDLEKLMNKGFIYIAKARYIMGSTCVTKMQLPTQNSNQIQPLATVFRKKINNNWVFEINRRDLCSKNSESTCSKNSESTSEDFKSNAENSEADFLSSDSSSVKVDFTGRAKTEFRNILDNDPKSLKKSKNAFLIEDNLYHSYNEEYLDKAFDSNSKESLVSVTDPIRLFGILVPKTMRQAQIIFIDVIYLLGKIATAHNELSEALHKYYHLEKVKRLIEAAATKMKLDILTPKVYWTPTESSTISSSEEETEVSSVEVESSLVSTASRIKFEVDNGEQGEEYIFQNSADSESKSNN